MATRTYALWRKGALGFIFFAFGTFAFTTATSEVVESRTEEKKSFLTGSNVPEPVRAALQRACQNCHSANTAWPWYAAIPPVSWQIHQDVARARSFMDFSKWNEYTEGQRRGFTLAIGAAIQGNLMPPSKYLWMHPEARLSADEIESIRTWAGQKNVDRPSLSLRETPAQHPHKATANGRAALN